MKNISLKKPKSRGLTRFTVQKHPRHQEMFGQGSLKDIIKTNASSNIITFLLSSPEFYNAS